MVSTEFLSSQNGMGSTNKERDEDCGVHHDQGQYSGPAVAKTVGDGSSQEHTDKGATLAGLEQSTLPLCFDDICAVVQDAISPLERGEGDKVAVQEHVEGFHDLVTKTKSAF